MGRQNGVVTASSLSMLASLWLVVAGLPVFQQPFAAVPEQPAAIALAAGEVSLRRPCLRLTCVGAEWEPPAPATTYAYRDDEQPVVRSTLPGEQRGGTALQVAVSRPDWIYQRVDYSRAVTGYGIAPIRNGDTTLQIEAGTGVRLQPYLDKGTAKLGPIARGRVLLEQRIGENADLKQELVIETGRANTYVHNALGVDMRLMPQLRLNSGLQIEHDSAGDGGRGSTDMLGNLTMQRDFGKRASLTQQVLVEAGDQGMQLRSAIGLQMLLRPQWTLSTRLEQLRDDTTNDGAPSTQGSFQLRRTF